MTETPTLIIPEFELSEEQIDTIKKGALESSEEEYLKTLGAEHAKLEKKMSKDEVVIEAFPSEPALVVAKLDEYWREARDKYKEVIDIRNIVDQVQGDPFSKWFFVNAERYEQATRLKWLYQQIKRLERLKVSYEKKQVEELLVYAKFETKEERKKYNIDRMFGNEGLLVDIASYDGMKLRGAGSRFQGICPFHTEKTPSFFIYVDNWYHCYGCGAHGNFINYLMKTRKIEFKEALAEADRFM